MRPGVMNGHGTTDDGSEQEVELNSGEDEAPESVSFAASKAGALDSFRARAASTRTNRTKLDQKRKAKQKQQQDQLRRREESRIRLEALREKAEEALKEDQESSQGGAAGGAPGLESPEKSVRRGVKKFNDDIVVVNSGSTKFKASLLGGRKGSQKLDNVAESVLNFRQVMLYGKGSRATRESVNKVMDRRHKMLKIKDLKTR